MPENRFYIKVKSLIQSNKKLIIFLLCFCILYFGTKGFIGITAKGGWYIKFLDEHLNFVAWYRYLIFEGSKAMLELLGYTATIVDPFHIQINNSNQVQMVYSCLGFGVISFWVAFVYSNEGSIRNKFLWIVSGTAAFVVLNMCRVAIILLADYKHFATKLPLDHHALFNLCSYVLIGIFVYAYTRSIQTKNNKTAIDFH
jgi:exosortase/archaeosortase family protein